MVANNPEFAAVVERCRSALNFKFRRGAENQAGPMLEAEIRAIEQQGREDALLRIVEFGDQLRHKGAVFHLIGAGASSVVLYLLGFSEVDPVRFRTHFERFWCSSSIKPPAFLFVVMPARDTSWDDIPRPPYVTTHSMTPLEAVPELLLQRLPEVTVPMNQEAVFAAIHDGDTDGVFQLESESVRTLLSQVHPPRIKTLATVTALEQISHSHPDITERFLNGLQERAESKSKGSKTVRDKNQLPILFQETIMEQLHRDGQIPWDRTYPFVQVAAKQKPIQGTEPLDELKAVIEQGHDLDRRQRLNQLAAASRWATCRAHHVANAITSYRAAYYRTFHRQEFEVALQQALNGERGN